MRGTANERLHEALRSATRTHHERLERRLGLVDPNLGLPRYLQLLIALHGFYAPLEARLRSLPGWDEVGLDIGARCRKHELLRDDLAALGVSRGEVSVLPRCRRLPSPVAAPEAMGCLYVLEGATLGGRVIARHLSSSLGLAPERGASFFAGYGAATDGRWRDFLLRLEPVAEGEGRRRRVLELAAETFDNLELWLERRGLFS